MMVAGGFKTELWHLMSGEGRCTAARGNDSSMGLPVDGARFANMGSHPSSASLVTLMVSGVNNKGLGLVQAQRTVDI